MRTGQAKRGTIVVDGRNRHYLAVGDGSPHPQSLLLAFHGSGGSAAQFRKFTGGGFDHGRRMASTRWCTWTRGTKDCGTTLG